MAYNRPSATGPYTGPPNMPAAQVTQIPTTVPGAPAKPRSELSSRALLSQIMDAPSAPARRQRISKSVHPFTTPQTQVIPTREVVPDAPAKHHAARYTNPVPTPFGSDKAISSAREVDMEAFLSIPPFSASQVQCILWLSWTTRANPAQIALMHNRTFTTSHHRMTRWNVVDIEACFATTWKEHGGSFSSVEPLPRLARPGDENKWSCLCDFGVANCYDYKRDRRSEENREKLSMATTLWDATLKEVIRCPHGKRKPSGEDSTIQQAPHPKQDVATTSAIPDLAWTFLAMLIAILLVVFTKSITLTGE